MRKILYTILALFLTVALSAQFTDRPGKIQLGYQTTANGLVCLVDSIPDFTPTDQNDCYLAQDTTANKIYIYKPSLASWEEFSSGISLIDSIENVLITSPVNGQVLRYDGTKWINSTERDTSDTNEIQYLVFSGDTLGLTDDPTSVVLPYLEESEIISIVSDSISLIVIDSTRLTQDSILVYFQDGSQVGRDTIALPPQTTQLTIQTTAGLDHTTANDTSTIDLDFGEIGDSPTIDGDAEMITWLPTGEVEAKYDIQGIFSNVLTSPNNTVTLSEISNNQIGVDVNADTLSKIQTDIAANAALTLQNVTDNGNTTTNDINIDGKITSGSTQVLSYPRGSLTGTLIIGNGGQNLLNSADNNGRFNTYVGIDAGQLDSAGYENTASGYQALFSNTTGYRNTANGFQALRFNTTGYQNTANGYQALFSNTTGNRNTANGFQALFSNTTGNNNTANGFQALRFNTTGYQNTANGNLALYFNTTGNNNTANGYQALHSNTTGAYNTANGYRAGRYITGNQSLDTASNSVFLGANTKALADNTTNEIVIGYNTTGNGANTVTIGNSSITDNYLKGNLHVAGNMIIESITEDNTNTSLLAADPVTGEVEERTVASLFSAKIESARNYSATTSGTGSVTVSHSLGVAPSVTVTNASATPYLISISSVTTTDFTILFYDTSGSTVNSTAVNFDYQLIIP